MRKALNWMPAMASALILQACADTTPSMPEADIILTGGTIYTVDDTRTVAEAIAVKDGKILALGSAAEIAAYKGTNTDVRDIAGKMVLPGLHDMHIHALETIKPEACDLDSTAISLADLVPLIQGCIETYQIPEGEWVPVLQWNPFEGNQPDKTYPTIRAALDGVSQTHKVYLYGNDGHHGAANSLALQSVTPALTADSLKTTYSKIADLVAVDSKGNPSGGLNEAAHMLVGADGEANLLAPPQDLMPKVAAHMAKTGLTSIQDASVSEQDLEGFKWLSDSGNMTFRVRTALHYPLQNGHSTADLEKVPAMIAWLEEQRAKLKDSPYIDPNATKLFADGVMEGNPYGHPPTMPVAAMLKPYHQPLFSINEETGSAAVTGYVDPESAPCKAYQSDPAAYADLETQAAFEAKNGFLPKQCLVWSGTLEHSAELIKNYIQAATDAGFHVHVHAIAEKAVQTTADAFEAAKASADRQGLTQSLAHVQIADPADLARLGKLGVYVAYTYHWIKPTPEYEMTVVPFVDQIGGADDLYNPEHKYIKNAYAVKTAIADGIIPVYGSDAPVESRDPRPFKNMQQALTREGTDAAKGLFLNPDEQIDIHTAIASYTRNSAALMSHADTLGTLEPGKTADIIVIDRNLVELAETGRATEIGETKVLTTIFDGKIVYDATVE